MKQDKSAFFFTSPDLGQTFAQMMAVLLPDAAIFTVDQDKKIRFWSSGAEKLLGFSASELTGEICLSGNRCPQCMKGCALSEYGMIEGVPLVLLDANGNPVPVMKYAMAFNNDLAMFTGGIEVLIPQKSAPSVEHMPLDVFDRYGMISHSPAMDKVFEMIKRVSKIDLPVLLRGESGTGKELVARAIHTESPRKNGPFIAVNCATLSAGLLESELFGHVKGAFTGAIKDHKGVFERAHGGTLFLDEIAELPLESQAKLLRVLELGECSPVGSEKNIKVDVRIIAATHRALREEVQQGRFRQDLLFRLRVIPIFLPSLKHRKTDIPLLTHHLLSQQFTKETMPQISPAALDCLMRYDWPGNVRELKNAIHYAMVMFDGECIEPQDLPPEIFAGVRLSSQSIAKPSGTKPALNFAIIQRTLDACAGNQSLAAKQLGIGRTTLWRFLKAHVNSAQQKP